LSSNSDERRTRAFLQHAVDPLSPSIERFVAEVGPLDAARRVEDGTGPGHALRARRTARATGAYADASLEFAEDNDIRFITPDDEWPAEQLAALAALAGLPTTDSQSDSFPLVLWVRGKRRLDELAARSVNVVGARVSTGYGDEHAHEIVHGLTGREVF
jgi:DNA processing protein